MSAAGNTSEIVEAEPAEDLMPAVAAAKPECCSRLLAIVVAEPRLSRSWCGGWPLRSDTGSLVAASEVALREGACRPAG